MGYAVLHMGNPMELRAKERIMTHREPNEADADKTIRPLTEEEIQDEELNLVAGGTGGGTVSLGNTGLIGAPKPQGIPQGVPVNSTVPSGLPKK
jgi:hypothetical protein